MALGIVAGAALGKDASPLGEIGKLVIQLIKAVATPLLFFAILNAILKTELQAKSGAKMVAIAMFNATIALCIGLLISNLIQPGKYLQIAAQNGGSAAQYAEKKIDFVKTFASYVPANLVTPFEENAIITVVLVALLLGFALRRIRGEKHEGLQTIEHAVAALLRVMEIVLTWIIQLIPFAVLGVVAKVFGEYGFAPLKGLGMYVGVALLGIFLHILITHQAWLFLYAKIGFKTFWSRARDPLIYATGANSSLATLPLTLRALDEMGVSKEASTLGACVGTNFNNDGIILYEGMAVLFVAQAMGIELTLGQQVLAAVSCLVAAMGVAGVPEAGFISLALVLNTIGLPVEILPLLLTVDWIIARARSVGNVMSDMVLSIAVDKNSQRRAQASINSRS